MTNGDEPAFPAEPKTQNDMGITYRGMSKREWLAGMAMQGIIGLSKECGKSPEQTSATILLYIDALLAELNKGTK